MSPRKRKKDEVDQTSALHSGDVAEFREWGMSNDSRTNITLRVRVTSTSKTHGTVVQGFSQDGASLGAMRDLPLDRLVRVKSRHEPLYDIRRRWLRR